MEGVSQGPMIERPKPPLTIHRLASLNRHGEVVKVLRMFLANGELADYDDELANRVHAAIEIVEGFCKIDRDGEDGTDDRPERTS